MACFKEFDCYRNVKAEQVFIGHYYDPTMILVRILLTSVTIFEELNEISTVGREVAFNTIDPRFESSHWEFLFIANCVEKMKIKQKRPDMAHFLKK